MIVLVWDESEDEIPKINVHFVTNVVVKEAPYWCELYFVDQQNYEVK